MTEQQTALIERINGEVQSKPNDLLLSDVGELLIDTVAENAEFASTLTTAFDATVKSVRKGKETAEEPSDTPLKDALKAHFDSLRVNGETVSFELTDIIAFLEEHWQLPELNCVFDTQTESAKKLIANARANEERRNKLRADIQPDSYASTIIPPKSKRLNFDIDELLS